MASGWSLFFGLIIIVALCLAAWFFSPKGENQTNRIPCTAAPPHLAEKIRHPAGPGPGVIGSSLFPASGFLRRYAIISG
ncbi:hypothetical protein N7462_011206 [Penicillium macrosclerotiorum]|uniref:uncharacterized protein n=1 Tax=Penicillium macrosclerotiorum TaxID=303699 RepID=UPI0025489E6B|nr:uncharacterized protein N7462_011206 [Penicillium macrosclerotiorum]KAJ5666797.1 hypothetical protein N7462_011206 [Penicillium macrosclerotiorum]